MKLSFSICTAVVTALTVAPVAHSEPVIVEGGWTLIRSISFSQPWAAHYNPVDGLIYVGRRASSGGLYVVNPQGYATKLASTSNPAAVVVDVDDGDVFVAEDYGGGIYRTAFGQTGRETWVSGFHGGDDDPIGMAIAPNDYTGEVLEPGQALVVDRGNSGSDGVWGWLPDVAQGEWAVHPDDGTLNDALDITINSSDVYLVDRAGTSDGIIYLLSAGGVLTPLATSEPLADPTGIAFDPLTGDLYVIESATDRLVRVDPSTGDVSDVFTGFTGVSWAAVDVTPDGLRVIVTDHAMDMIYVFARCDAAGGTAPDCNENGQADFCDIHLGTSPDCNGNQVPDECDLSSGSSDDCNEDGWPDECPVCPLLDLVFVMDTSTSMDDEAAALCQSMDAVIAQLLSAGLEVSPTLLGISNNPGGAYGCLTDNVINLLGTAVPGTPPPGLELLGDCPGGYQVASEDWGLATAVVAGEFPWMPDAMRLIVPISDEGSWCGDPVTQMDVDAIAHAIVIAQEHSVIVSPITGTGSSGSVIALAQQIAEATGGVQSSSSSPDQDIAEAIVELVMEACSVVTDCNENDVLDECEVIGPGDYDADGDIDVDDFAGLPSCMGGPVVTPVHPVEECIQACLDAFDLDIDLDVDLHDFAEFQLAFTGSQ